MDFKNILSNLFGTDSVEAKRDVPLTFDIADQGLMAQLFPNSLAETGDIQSLSTAVQNPAFSCAVEVLSGTIASLPVEIHKKNENGSEIVRNHPFLALLNEAMDDDLTAYDGKKRFMTNLLLTGRAYLAITKNRLDDVISLEPLMGSVSVEETKSGFIYKQSYRGKEKIFQPSQIVDAIWKLLPDGQVVDTVTQFKNTIALVLAADRYASTVFLSGGLPPLVVKAPPAMGDNAGQITRLSADMEQLLKKARQDKKQLIVTPAGIEIDSLDVNPEQNQLLQFKQWSVEEIARIFSIPTTFLQDHSNSTFSNAQQLDLHFVKHTITPWTEKISQLLTLRLFGRGSEFVIKFNTDRLLEADISTQAEAHSKWVMSGTKTQNENRAKIGLPPKPEGDDLMIQSGTTKVKYLPDESSTATTEPNDVGTQATDTTVAE